MLARNLSRFRLITFDVTDTVLKFTKPPVLQYKETAEKFGITSLNEQQLLASFKPCFMALSQKYPNYGSGSDIDWTIWWTQLVADVLNKSSSAPLDANVVHEVGQCLVNMYETEKCWQKFECAEEIVTKIQNSQKCVGVITNSDPRVKRVLKNVHLTQFQFVLTSYEMGVMKPQKEIFDAALKRSEVKWLEPQEALHIGNKYDVDVVGAQNAGWTGVLIQGDGGKDLPKERNFHVFKDLKDFLNTLETKELTWTS